MRSRREQRDCARWQRQIALAPNAYGIVSACRGQTRPPPFIPFLFSPALWLDPPQPQYQDATKTVLCTTNGDLVYTSPDYSGFGLDAVQATSANRPTYNPTGWNGLPCIAFSAAGSQFLQHASASQFQISGSYTGACWFYVNANSSQQVLMGKFATSNQGEYLFYVQNGIINLNLYTNGVAAQPLSGPACSAAAWHFGVWWYDASAGTMNVQLDNGAVSSQAVTVSPGPTSQIFTVGARIGAGSGSLFLDGRLGPVYCFPGVVLTASQIAQLYAYQR